MQKADPLIRTKLHLPLTRSGLVPRPRLQSQIAQGLRGPLTLVAAPAGSGKTTLVASSVAGCGMPVAWLSLDEDDDRPERFLTYLVAALREADPAIGGEAARLLAAARQPPPDAILTSLINDLDAGGSETVLVLDDYQFISTRDVHEQVAFVLQHCPETFHLVIATRSDPPLPVTRLRARGRTVELREADLRFTRQEAGQFLNDVMGLGLDAGSVAILEDRTEGWIVGLQMAALSMRGREDVRGFVEGFSGTNRYILDYLLEEVLSCQPADIRHFLLHTSILERLNAPLCDAILADDERFRGRSCSILEYLERANLFLVPLDDERTWYRYHHLFADLLRSQLRKLLGARGVAQLHVRAADWHAQNASVVEAIYHASAAEDDERVERFIQQNYMEMVSRGEQSALRAWTGRLSRELVYRRPWLCIYEAYSHSWFGELDEADRLLEEAERRIRSDASIPDANAMMGLLLYVRSRVAAMRGNLRQAIAYCRASGDAVSAGNLALLLDTRITLGYEYFLVGDYASAIPILDEVIRSGIAAGAVINTVAASCLMARLVAVQGHLHSSYDTYQATARSIPEGAGQHLGSRALVEIGVAEVLCEWNDLDAALARARQGLALMPWWGKADDWVLTYVTLARIDLAQADQPGARDAVEKAMQVIEASGVFSEARTAAEIARVRLWLAHGDLQAADRWAASQEECFRSDGGFRFENELHNIARARILIARNRPEEAIDLLSRLEASARPAGRMGRVIEILLLEALALQAMGDAGHARRVFAECLALAEPEGYVRIFLDEGRPMQKLLAQWLAYASASPRRDYAIRLLCQFDAEPHVAAAAQGTAGPAGGLIEALSGRELEVLQAIALGKTNREIADQLIVAPGTVKAHTASIYRKLDVANRTEAVARARQLGILS